MRPLSATDAFTPALERTKAMLQPFSLKLWLKLGLVALIAEMGMQFFVPPAGGSSHASSPSTGPLTPILVTALIIGACVGLVLCLIFIYFGSRMQLVLMEMVATRSTFVTPSWRKAGPKTWPWIGLKLACFLIAFAVVGAIIALPIIYLIRTMPASNTAPPNPAFWGSFFLVFITVFVAAIAIILVLWTLRDFVLPFVVFENAPIGTAISSARELIRRETGSVFFYFLMKFVFTLAASLAAELCILGALLLIAIPVGLIGGGFWLALHNAGDFGTLFLYITLGVLGVIGLGAFFVAIICIAGAVLIFYQAYALYFLGGRIPQLGDLLEPPPPPSLQDASPALSPS